MGHDNSDLFSPEKRKKKKKKTTTTTTTSDNDLRVNDMDKLHFKVWKVLLYY